LPGGRAFELIYDLFDVEPMPSKDQMDMLRHDRAGQHCHSSFLSVLSETASHRTGLVAG
jgi:hypothetical protein